MIWKINDKKYLLKGLIFGLIFIIYLSKTEGLYRTGKVQAALDLLKKAGELSEGNMYYNSLVDQMYSKLGLEKEAAQVNQKTSVQ